MKRKGTILILLGFIFLAAAAAFALHNRQEEEKAETAAAAVMEVLRQEITPAEESLPAASDIPAGEKSGGPAEQKKTKSKSGSETHDVVYPDYVLDPYRDMPEMQIDDCCFIGYLEVPALGISQPVQSEWSYPNLRISACRFTGSVYTNDLVVCGHNYFPGFGLLSNVAVGDLVRFTDIDGNIFDFEVAGVELLSPDDSLRMVESEWDLTLFTCTLSTASRVTVRCTAVQKDRNI